MPEPRFLRSQAEKRTPDVAKREPSLLDKLPLREQYAVRTLNEIGQHIGDPSGRFHSEHTENLGGFNAREIFYAHRQDEDALGAIHKIFGAERIRDFGAIEKMYPSGLDKRPGVRHDVYQTRVPGLYLREPMKTDPQNPNREKLADGVFGFDFQSPKDPKNPWSPISPAEQAKKYYEVVHAGLTSEPKKESELRTEPLLDTDSMRAAWEEMMGQREA